MRRWNEYWFAPRPLIDLAVVRIILVGAQLGLLLFYKNYAADRFYDFAHLPIELYNPIPIIRLLFWPFDWDYRPSYEALRAIYYIAIVSGTLALVGFRTNLSLCIFTLSNIIIIGHFYSYMDIHHTEAPLIIALVLLTISPCGRLLSVDDWLARRNDPRGFWSISRLTGETSPFGGWAILTIEWLFVLIYLSAVLAKLVYMGGLDWLNGYTLQYYLIVEGTRRDIPLALWLAQYHYLVMTSQYAVVIFQLTFALAIIYPRLKWIYFPIGMGFHIGNIVLLGAKFPEWIALYAVFIPWHAAIILWHNRRVAPQPVATA